MRVEVVAARPSPLGHRAGELLVTLLRGHVAEAGEAGEAGPDRGDDTRSVHDVGEWVIFAQIHGHMSVDPKWAMSQHKLVDMVEESEDLLPIDRPQNLPLDPIYGNQSICVMTSSKVPVCPRHLLTGGVVVEAALPVATLPSYRGRGCSVQYFLTLQLQSPSASQTLHFPFVLHSPGVDRPTVPRQYVGLVAYPLRALPGEVFTDPALSCASDRLSLGQSAATRVTAASQSFKVRDRGHVCNVHVHGVKVAVGGTITVALDFAGSEQTCRGVRATLLQEQRRADGSVLHEKVLARAHKHTETAVTAALTLALPADGPSSARFPFGAVAHRLLLEFFLDADVLDAEVFSFEVAVEVTAGPLPGEQSVDALEANLNKSQLVGLCLDAPALQRPLRESQLAAASAALR